jgi:pimeloyl-ACP methyl ester carboxylesterase
MLWLSIAVARNVVHHSNLAYSSFWAPPLAFAVFVVLRLTFGRLLFIRFALDDWYFAREFIHRVRPGIGDRLDRFARELVRLARETDADEIIIYGHSLGAPLSLVVVDRALELDPRLGRRGRPVHVVSSGSSLLKVALHPAAGWLREAVARVANAPIYWVEFQALVDIINVYKVNPVAALGIAPTGRPIIKTIRIRLMVEEATQKRFHLNFPYPPPAMGNERRYFTILHGSPHPLIERVANSDGAVAAFSAEGV